MMSHAKGYIALGGGDCWVGGNVKHGGWYADGRCAVTPLCTHALGRLHAMCLEPRFACQFFGCC